MPMETGNMKPDYNKIILTDADGVLLNWEYAFRTWMAKHGYEEKSDDPSTYDIGIRYGIPKAEKESAVKLFNESAAIGYLPPLRDAMYYVDLLHRKHGYTFHCITSLSTDQDACNLREQNIKKLFGETAFSKFIFLDTGADKDKVLAMYKDSGYIWIEDKVENAQCGLDMGLESILIEHGHNMHSDICPKMKDWKEVYEYCT